tara:strand:- start:1747 stop:1908 length:162 start_codon:yes stop_codon:yes gene_type:complete
MTVEELKAVLEKLPPKAECLVWDGKTYKSMQCNGVIDGQIKNPPVDFEMRGRA